MLRRRFIPLMSAYPGWLLETVGPTLAPHVTFAASDVLGRYGHRLGGRHSRFIEGYESRYFSNSRASTRWAPNASGVYTSFASGVTARSVGVGALLAEERANKCTNYNANPPALVTMGTLAAFNAAGVTNVTANGGDGATLFGIIDDTAALAAAGLGNITNGRAYKIDNSAGTVGAYFRIAGTTGNTNPHVVSVYTKGTNSNGLYLEGSAGYVGSGVHSTYDRVSGVKTPTSSGAVLAYSVEAGQIAYFILNSLEEATFLIDSPIVTAGATGSVLADIRSLTNEAATAALAAQGAYFETEGVAGGTAPRLFEAAASSSNSYFNTTTTINAQNTANIATATIGGSGTQSGTTKTAFSFGASSFSVIANGGTKASNANAFDILGTVIHGNRSAGDRALNGNARWMILFDIPVADKMPTAL